MRHVLHNRAVALPRRLFVMSHVDMQAQTALLLLWVPGLMLNSLSWGCNVGRGVLLWERGRGKAQVWAGSRLVGFQVEENARRIGPHAPVSRGGGGWHSEMHGDLQAGC